MSVHDPNASLDEDNLCVTLHGRVGGVAQPMPGARIEYCDRCKSPIWVAPSSDKAVESADKYMRLCLECGVPEVKARGMPAIPMDDGQIAEMARATGLSEDIVRERMRRLGL